MAWTTPKTWSVGETLTAANFNAHIRDNLNVVPHLIARKTADQSVTSSTVLVDCTTMAAPVAANEVWFLWWNITFTASPTSMDIQLAYTFPASGHIAHSLSWADASGVAQVLFWGGTTTPTTGVGLQSNSATNQQTAVVQGMFTNAGTPGNVQLQFAQATSGGTATTVKANSSVLGFKLA